MLIVVVVVAVVLIMDDHQQQQQQQQQQQHNGAPTPIPTPIPPPQKSIKKTQPRRRRRRRRRAERKGKVRPADYAQCYFNLREFLRQRLDEDDGGDGEDAATSATAANPDLMPTDDDIRKMFGKDRAKSNHAPAKPNPCDAADPALRESGNYAPSGGPGFEVGCNVGAPSLTLNREDRLLCGLRLWPEGVVAPLCAEFRLYLQAFADPQVSEPQIDPLEEHRKPAGPSRIRYRQARPLW